MTGQRLIRLDRTLFTDVKSYLPGDLLVKADRMTMAASLEGRSPLLDHEYFEWTARLPIKYKLHGRKGKYLLRKAFGHLLPEENRRYRKQGFSLPVGAWFKGPLAGWARETLLGSDSRLQEWFEGKVIEQILAEHSLGRNDHGKRIWALMVLELWLQQQVQINFRRQSLPAINVFLLEIKFQSELTFPSEKTEYSEYIVPLTKTRIMPC